MGDSPADQPSELGVLGWFLKLTKDHERFKNVADGLQSLALALAVLFGGLWAAYQFYALHRGDLAQADLTAKRIANERAPVVMVDVKSEDKFLPDLRRHVVIADVTIENVGSDTAVLKMQSNDPDKPVMAIYKYDPKQQQFIRLTIPVHPATHDLTTLTIRPRSHEVLHYLFDVRATGTYMVVFGAFGRQRFDEDQDPTGKAATQATPAAGSLASGTSTTLIASNTTVTVSLSTGDHLIGTASVVPAPSSASNMSEYFPYRYLGTSIVDVPVL